MKSHHYNTVIKEGALEWGMVDHLRRLCKIKIKGRIKSKGGGEGSVAVADDASTTGFDDVIYLHFLLKRKEILKQLEKWCVQHEKSTKMRELQVELVRLFNELFDLD